MADVTNAGGSRHQAFERVDRGQWDQHGRGLFRVAGVAWSYEARVMGAILAAGPGAVASHQCAARLLGIGFRNAPPEISIPRGRRHRPADIRVHESTDLDRCSIRIVDGIPVTDPARTLLDVGRYIGPVALRRAVEQARRLELTTWSTLIACLARHARQGRHGVRRLRMVIAAGMDISEVTDTDSELMALTLLLEHGFEPALHHRIYDDNGELFAEIDIAFAAVKGGIEIDGTIHLDPEVRDKDLARDYELNQLGWTIRRVSSDIPVRQPDRFLRLARRVISDAERLAELETCRDPAIPTSCGSSLDPAAAGCRKNGVGLQTWGEDEGLLGWSVGGQGADPTFGLGQRIDDVELGQP